jgi:thymidylate synthase ThyX
MNDIKVELISSWQGNGTGDGSVAHAAWASSTDFEKLDKKSDEDIRRIATNVVKLHHDTPKERVWLEFFITMPIFCERQYDKYRMTLQHQDFRVDFSTRIMGGDSITQNELSGRYRTIPERVMEMPQDVSGIIDRAYSEGDILSMGSSSFEQEWKDELHKQYEYYKRKLTILKEAEVSGRITNTQYKRAREFLRGVLGTAYLTDARICMNLNAFEHILNQRLPDDAQRESQIVAYYMLEEVQKHNVAPITITQMMETNGWQLAVTNIERYLNDGNI